MNLILNITFGIAAFAVAIYLAMIVLDLVQYLISRYPSTDKPSELNCRDRYAVADQITKELTEKSK